jgi:hypothetical protein
VILKRLALFACREFASLSAQGCILHVPYK